MDSLSHLRDYIALEAGNGAVSPVDLLNEQRTRVRQWLGRAPVWRAVGLIAEQLMSKTRIGSAEVLQAYLEARSADQQTLALGWDFSSPVRRRP